MIILLTYGPAHSKLTLKVPNKNCSRRHFNSLYFYVSFSVLCHLSYIDTYEYIIMSTMICLIMLLAQFFKVS